MSSYVSNMTLVQCPLFYGTRVIRNRTFMRLENISVGAKGVMDVKIGSVTWDRFASKEKVLAEKSKYPWREELSFRILGFRVSTLMSVKS